MRVQREDAIGAVKAAWARGEIGLEILVHPGSADLAREVLNVDPRGEVEERKFHIFDGPGMQTPRTVFVRPSRDIPRGAFALKSENRGFIGYI